MSESTRELSDEVVFARVCEGEKDLYRILFDRYKSLVAGIIFKMTGERTDLEDIVADVFMAAYEKRGQFRHSGSFRAWLFKIAINAARMHQRKWRSRGRKIKDFNEIRESVGVSAGVASNSVGQTDSRNSAMEYILRLRPKVRTVFILRDIEGLSYEEIAKIINRPVGTVRSRLNAARKVMLRLVKESGDAGEV